MMLNFINIMAMNKIQDKNFFAAKNDGDKDSQTISTVSMLREIMSPSEFNSISSQIEAMQELDTKNKVGKKLNISS